MTKRVMVQMPVSVGIKTVFDEREDIECEVFTELSEENILQHIGNYDAAILGIAPFTARIVGAASRLKIVSRFGVGYDAVDVDALTRAGIPLAVVGSANSVTVAEHALMFMLALAKHTVAYDRMVRKGAWEIRFDHPPVDLAGRTVLILGFGRIGRRLVKRCLGMEMTVLVHDPYVIQDAIATAGAEPVGDWRAALPDVDFLSVNCPKNAETNGMVGSPELAVMKETAYVVNTARGGIVGPIADGDAQSVLSPDAFDAAITRLSRGERIHRLRRPGIAHGVVIRPHGGEDHRDVARFSIRPRRHRHRPRCDRGEG